MEQYCRESGIKYLITLTDYDLGQAKVKVIDNERITEKRYNIDDIVEEMVKRLHTTEKSVSR